MESPEVQLDRMTLDEKASLLVGDSPWTTPAISRLGIPSVRFADGPHGVRRTSEDSMVIAALPATCFPTASCAAGTWNPELIREMAGAIAREAIALRVDVVLGPGVNMKRSPLCGRNFEYFSEDPYLAGVLGVAWVEGLQALGVGASLKHFAVNNQETRRMSVDAEVDERTLRETYLSAFERVVRQAQPWTVMCAYNKVNGTYASENHLLLTQILRDEWGFDGVVISDWGAVHDRPASLAAGLDIEMPGPRPRRVRSVVEAVKSGLLDEGSVDRAVLRVLRLAAKAQSTAKGAPFDTAAHHALARRIAAEGVVLLKNDGVLPIRACAKVAVIGPAARAPRFQGGGSSEITPTRVDSPVEELRGLAAGASIAFAEGCREDETIDSGLVAQAVELAASSDVALIYAAMPEYKESEGHDRSDLDLPEQQVGLIHAVCAVQPNTVVVLLTGSTVTVSSWADEPAAILEAGFAGQAAGGAIADVLYGKVNPSGRLAETFPKRLEDTPSYLAFPGDRDDARYGEGLFIGYRWYSTRGIPVHYPFGHGLSYTTFEYRDVRTSALAVDPDSGVTVTIDVANTGSMDGSEVVQVYVRPLRPRVHRPLRELAGFSKVQIGAGHTRTVAIHLDTSAFAYWDSAMHDWTVDGGDYYLEIGASSEDIRASVPVSLVPPDRSPLLTPMSPLSDWVSASAPRDAVRALMADLLPVLVGAFDQDTTNFDNIPAVVRTYFGAMPLRSVLEFAEPSGGPDPDTSMTRLMSCLGT
jgi:beta-glucosidase